MVRRREIVARATKAQRRIERQRLGRLRDNRISPNQLQRYAWAFTMLTEYFHAVHSRLPGLYEALDRRVASYIEELWHNGEGKNMAQTTLASVQFFVQASRGKLQLSWRLMHTWEKLELPNRATPLTELQILGMAGVCVQWGQQDVGIMLIVSFALFLRTGEIMKIHANDVLIAADGRTATITLYDTKGLNRRMEILETVVLDDRWTIELLRKLKNHKLPGDRLMPLSSYKFRQVFRSLLAFFGLNNQGYQPYSLRRGGATHHFRRFGNMSRTIEIGRWASVKTARIYIEEGAAVLQEIKLSPQQVSLLKAFRAHFLRMMANW